MQNNLIALELRSNVRRLPSKKPRRELRSNDCAEHYRRAIPESNERNGIARATQRVSGGTKSSRDDAGDGAARLQLGRRAFPKRPNQGCQWDGRKEWYAKDAARRGHCLRSKNHPSPRLGAIKEQHREGNRDRNRERKKDQCPVRCVLQTRTHRSHQKRRSRADHAQSKDQLHRQPFQMSRRVKVGPWSHRRQHHAKSCRSACHHC
jgi:hypothetical protein